MSRNGERGLSGPWKAQFKKLYLDSFSVRPKEPRMTREITSELISLLLLACGQKKLPG